LQDNEILPVKIAATGPVLDWSGTRNTGTEGQVFSRKGCGATHFQKAFFSDEDDIEIEI